MAASRASAISAAAVPIAFVLANAVSYALLLVAAHVMNAADYGKLSSLLGLLLISSIPMLALQTVTARRAATDVGTAGIVRGTALVGSLAAAALVVLSPALAEFLHLSSVAGILLVAATVPASAVLGTAMGVAQGRRHFMPLAVLMLASTGGRSVGGLVGLFIGRSPNTTLLGVLVGTGAAAVVVAAAGHGFAGHRDSLRDRSKLGVLNETLHAGHALGTFLLLTSLDVLLARHVLNDTDAGAYAVGSVVTRAAVWLPQSVITLMFASLSESHRHRETARRAGAAVVALGVCVVAGSAALGSTVVSVVGGGKYHRLDDTIWLYALLGSLLSVLQLAVLAGLAQRRARRVALLWLTIAVDVTAVLIGEGDATPTRLVATLVVVTSGAALAALALTLGGSSPDDRQVLAPDGHGPGV
jgi:O-antigen/teichoic acid export membrane protein